MHIKIKLASLLSALMFCMSAFAQEVPQPTANNPFSRFGVGDVVTRGYATQLGMGGIGIGFNDPHIASPNNPAALGALRYTSYQVGVGLERSILESNGQENRNVDGNLDYLSLSFPLQNSLQRVLDGKTSKWRNGMMLALSPYSDVGYNVELVSAEPALGEVVTRFLGSGGFYRLQWGNGVSYENFRAGLNLSYVFGRTNNQQVLFARSEDGLSIGSNTITDTDALRARGVEAEFGAQYDWILASNENRPTKVLTFGATTTLGASLSGEASRIITSRNLLNALDTIVQDVEASEALSLPNQFGLGVFYRHINKLTLGLDVSRVNWSQFSNSLRPEDNLSDVTRINFGGEWIPNYKAFGKYWARAAYRFGYYQHQDPRVGVNPERGFTFGLGLPIVRPREEVSYVNLSLNTGQLTTEGDISQRFVRLTVGFTLTDNSWFYKRRFN